MAGYQSSIQSETYHRKQLYLVSDIP
ncbi:hypothetical protein CEXT_260801, partial [Caerostris extrusa]